MTCWTTFGRVFVLSAFLALAAGAQELHCPAGNPPGGRNFRGQTIERGNFSYQDLTNADFSGATLISPYFAYANLTNATFEGATIINNGANPALVNDFSFATLEKTCFIDARFEGLTYFTNATLTCADFSKVDLSSQNVMFGDSQLTFDRARQDCRLAFRFAVMNCEFLSSWQSIDLTGAEIKACASQFARRDFSGAKLNGVDFGDVNLDGTKFVQAELNGANLEKASLIGADLSYASLLGANLTRANLTNATLYNAFLSNDTGNGIRNAASLRQAHLKNANLSFAHLSGVDLTFANLYGDTPASGGTCKTALSLSQCSQPGSSNYQGFACHCASAHGATMRQTNFSSAYLYGVDFTDAAMQSVNFRQAVLTGANLRAAAISTDPQSGSPTTFLRAFLQGANFAGAEIRDETNFSDAFVDFRPLGNNIYIYLDGDNHNQFACRNCSPATRLPVCVFVNYPAPTAVPRSGVRLFCPSGGPPADCGPATSDGSNTRWQSTIIDLAAPPPGVLPAWYQTDSTYIRAPANPRSVCDIGKGPIAPTFEW